jgi:hypothetical protein
MHLPIPLKRIPILTASAFSPTAFGVSRASTALNDRPKIANDITELIGNTPLLRLQVRKTKQGIFHYILTMFRFNHAHFAG